MSDKFVRFDKPKNNQDFFDKAWQWLIVENRPKCVESGSTFCLYREKDIYGNAKLNGHSCIIGAFIPDNLIIQDGFTEQLEGTVFQIIELFPNIRSIFKNVEIPLLRSVQIIHDKNKNRQKTMTEIARQFNLAIPIQSTKIL